MRHSIIPAVALLLESPDGKLFVGRRQNTGYHDGKLNLPAGHIDPNETPRQALVRECREEVGIELLGDALQFVHVQYNRNLEREQDRTHYYFKISSEGLTPKNTEPEKCNEVLWVSPWECLDEFVPFMAAALEAIGSGQVYSEYFDTTTG